MQHDIATIPASAEQAAGNAHALMVQAEQFTLATADDYTIAADRLRAIKGLARQLDDERKAATGPLDAAKKRIMDWFRGPQAELEQAEAKYKSKMLAFDREQQRIRQEAERQAAEVARKERERLQAEAAKAEEAARRKREEQEAKARALEEAGRAERAAALREAAEEKERAKQAEAAALRMAAETMPAAPVVHAEQPKAAGISTRTDYDFEIEDASRIPSEYMIPDEKAIRRVVKALGARTNIPGIRVIEKQIMSARAG